MQDLDSRIRQFLSSHGIKLNTNLGQHFLRDETVLDAIMEGANITPDDHVVEIGPGIGVLTERLLEKAAKVTAIELDHRMIPLLHDFVRPNQKPVTSNQLTIVQGNALHTPMPTAPYKVVANIPYHITSPLLRHVFLESPVHPSSLTLLMQREVAEKICDQRHRGLLTIVVELFGVPRLLLHVPPECFIPEPEVDSAVLQISCFDVPKADPETIEKILTLLKLAFGGKRKMLRNTLGSLPHGGELLKATNIDGTRRPETLTVDEWITVAKKSKEIRV